MPDTSTTGVALALSRVVKARSEQLPEETLTAAGADGAHCAKA
ncbi:hypothetical protein [Brucella sp. 22210]